MRYQLLALAWLTCGIPALVLPSSALAQEADAPASQEASEDVERSETGDGDDVRSDRQRRGGPLALSSNEATVEWILPTHQSIIALAETAKENAKSAEVRSFAETLHAEHTEFVNQLKAASEEEAERRRQIREERRSRRLENRGVRGDRRTDRRSDRRSEPDAADADNGSEEAVADEDSEESRRRVVLERLAERAERVAERAEETLGDVVDDAATRASRRLRVAARGFPWIQVRQKTAENALTMAKEDLEARQAFEFDQVYLGYASAQHVQAIAELNAVESEASEDTKQLIENHLPKMQRHRNTANQLMKQLSESGR